MRRDRRHLVISASAPDRANRHMLVIFDCDGVLVDTEEINRQAMIAVLHDNGIEMAEAEAARELQGLSNLGIVEKVKELRGVTLGDRFIRDLDAKESEFVRRSVQPVEGVRDAVTHTINGGFATCVASNGALAAMRERLTCAGLIDLFTDRLFSAEQVARGKPSPDVFLYAAASMGHSPDACIVVEDSLVGVVAGRAAGMSVLAFAKPSRLALTPALEAAGGVVFNRMEELPQILADRVRKCRLGGGPAWDTADHENKAAQVVSPGLTRCTGCARRV